MSKIKSFSIFFIFILIFSILVNIVLANSECNFNISGSTAVIENCGLITIVEGNALNITFISCKKIQNFNNYFNNGYGKEIADTPCHKFENMLICNQKPDEKFLPLTTYDLHVECSDLGPVLAPYIEVLKPEYKPIKQIPPIIQEKNSTNNPTINNPPRWNSNINSFIINGTLTLNLSKFFIDGDNDVLNYIVYNKGNFTITIMDGIANIVSNGYIGNQTVIFSARDGKSIFNQKILLISIGEVKNSLTIWKIILIIKEAYFNMDICSDYLILSAQLLVVLPCHLYHIIIAILYNKAIFGILIFMIIIIIAILIARLRGATWEEISLGYLRNISKVPIPEKTKKPRNKKSKL